MKYYTIEMIPHTLEANIRVFRANGVEEFCAIVQVNLVEGYCRCLEDLGYCHKEMEN